MTTKDKVNEFVPRGPKRELMRLIGQMQALNAELDALRQRGAGAAAVARRAATDVRRPAV
jgi:hypothetical protein